jgi:hypothetical protein
VEFEGGSMIDWQMDYNGLTFGASTVYGIESITGLHDLPEVRTSDRARARTHGQFQGSDYLGGRDIDVSVTITSKHPSNAIWQAFSQALVAGQVDELPLTIQVPGEGQETVFADKHGLLQGCRSGGSAVSLHGSSDVFVDVAEREFQSGDHFGRFVF